VRLEGKAKSMRVSGALAPDGESRNTARPLKRQGGGREPDSGYETLDHSEGQANPTKAWGDGNISCRLHGLQIPGGAHRVRRLDFTHHSSRMSATVFGPPRFFFALSGPPIQSHRCFSAHRLPGESCWAPGTPHTYCDAMDFTEILKPESVILDLEKGSKKEIIRHLVGALPVEMGKNGRDEILKAVMEREQVMSTGIGRGVAIPHAKTDRVDGILVSVGIANEPIPFDAIDDKPCRIFFLVVSDPGATSPHVKVLSHISRILNDPAHKEALETARTREEVVAALTAG